MVIDDNSYSKVYWIGSNDPNVYLPQLAHKNVYFYKKCIFGPMTIEIGEYVLISNADSAEPDTISGCDIAKVLHLYELEEDSKTDPFRAVVQWYSRPEKVPHKFFDSDFISIDFDIELIEDYRPFDRDVSIETIFRKCVVITGNSTDTPLTLLHNKNSVYPMFVCRYKLVKVKSIYKLIPLELNENDEHQQQKSSVTKTPKRNSIKNTPNKTPKLSRKKIVSEYAVTPSSRSQKSNRNLAEKLHDLEFIDVNNCVNDEEAKNLVSPIKIVRKTVVKISRQNFDTVSEKKYSKSASQVMEMNGNYLGQSPEIEKNRVNNYPVSKLNIARRNLNISLDNETENLTADSDVLNYSIIRDIPNQNKGQNEMKIKLRLSDKQKESSRKLSEHVESPEITDLERLPTTQKRSVDLSTIKSTSGRTQKATRSLSRKRSIDESNLVYSETSSKESSNTPTKRSHAGSIEELRTPSSRVLNTPRRKSILKTPGDRPSVGVGTPKRIQLSNIVEERIFTKNSIISTPTSGTPTKKKFQNADNDNEFMLKTPKRRKSISKTPNISITSTQKMKLIRSGALTPSIDAREKTLYDGRRTDLQLIRERLHVSAIPESLPCREAEFQNIYSFLEGKIEDQCGGCMYISGVPGTGKTATVTGVINCLKRAADHQEISQFEFIGINGMRLTEPRQAYVHIYKQLTGKTVSWQHAHALLEKRFTTPAPRRTPTVLLVDELDILCNRRQDVVYNLLDWPTKSSARLVVVTIANTMDLPERLLMGKITSRLGLTRLTFQPYTHKQLQDIVMARLSGSDSFKSDAVQLVARKVASVSGDARRALDICRRATEITEESKTKSEENKNIVNMIHVQQALGEMIASAKVQAIKNCSKLEQIFLQAVSAEVARTGVEETNFLGVYSQIESITAFMGIPTLAPGRALKICGKLGSERLLICEHSRTDIFQKIILNVSTDDIHYALQIKVN